MSDDTNLYTVLDVEANGTVDGQHVEIYTSLDDATSRRDELHTMAIDDREVSDFRVFQLVEPGAVTPDFTRHDRVLALDLAVKLHIEDGLEPVEVVQSAAHFAAFLAEGTGPAGPYVPDVRVAVKRTDDAIEVWVNGELAASTDYDQSGHAGMDALENAVVRLSNAVGIEIEDGGEA